MRLVFFIIGFALPGLWACDGKRDVNVLNPTMDNFLKSDIHLDDNFKHWYLESKFDSIIANKSRVTTRLQNGIVALTYIELDSIQQAEKLLSPFIVDGKIQDKVPKEFHFYEGTACYRIAELRESDSKKLFQVLRSTSIMGTTSHWEDFYIMRMEGEYFSEVVKEGLSGEHEFKQFSDSLLYSYPNYLRGKFLTGTYNYYYKHYDSAIPLLTELYNRNYRKNFTGALLYDYYLQKKPISDSAKVYQSYKGMK